MKLLGENLICDLFNLYGLVRKANLLIVLCKYYVR